MAAAHDALGCPLFFELPKVGARFYPQHAAQIDWVGAAVLPSGYAVSAGYVAQLFLQQEVRYDGRQALGACSRYIKALVSRCPR
jgi:hypothetical protein